MNTAKLSQIEVEAFKAEVDELYSNRLCSPYPNVSKEQLQNSGVIIYGLGLAGKNIVSALLQHNITVSWIVDKNDTMWGQEYLGVPIQSVSSLASANERFVLLASTHIVEMVTESLRHNASKWILPAAVRNFCFLTGEIGICNDRSKNIDELLSGFELMADERSRDIYRAFIRYHYIYKNDFTDIHDPKMYFPNDLIPKMNYNCFVDVGAYTGDTLSDWIKYNEPDFRERKYYCFEPDLSSYCMLMHYLDSLPDSIRELISAHNFALGSEEKYYDANQTRDDKQKSPFLSRRLDDIFSEENPTIIKADIEGSEIDMLEGAKATISRCRPSLAISVYHRYSDLWSIPLWIKSLNCGYDIYLRHHPKVFTDTVCYAIAGGR